MKKKSLIIILVLVLILVTVLIILSKTKKNKIANVKVPILLYHDFVTTVPDNDSDNFSYINTPQSFEENIKVLLENGYTIISFQELNDMQTMEKLSFQKDLF